MRLGRLTVMTFDGYGSKTVRPIKAQCLTQFEAYKCLNKWATFIGSGDHQISFKRVGFFQDSSLMFFMRTCGSRADKTGVGHC